MHEQTVQERRQHERIELTTCCPTTFDYKGRSFQALMVNLSDTGAGFELGSFFSGLQLQLHDELQLSIKTPYGLSLCHGIVCWIEADNDRYTWGIQFNSQTYNPEDPLLNLIDSPY